MKIQIRTRHGFARSLALPALISIVLVSFGLSLAACGKGGTAGDENAAAKDSTGSTGGNTAATGDGDHKTAAADTGAANGKPSEKKERPVSVDASAAIRGDLVVPVSAEGAVRSLHSAEIKVEISGRIAAIAAKEGQSIKKGSLILRLDSREYEVAADEARSRYLQALSALAVEEDSVGSVERPSELQQKIRELEKLEKQGSITREERLAQEISLDVQALRGGAFRTDMAATRSGVTAARAAVERAYLNLERTEIRAPFSGVVSGLRLSTGEQMMAGQTVCSLVNNIELEAVVGVLEADIGHLEKGGRALIVLTALDDTLETQIGVISPQFDRSTRTCDVLLPISNSEGRVRSAPSSPARRSRTVFLCPGRRYLRATVDLSSSRWRTTGPCGSTSSSAARTTRSSRSSRFFKEVRSPRETSLSFPTTSPSRTTPKSRSRIRSPSATRGTRRNRDTPCCGSSSSVRSPSACSSSR
jgi:multidrug efflux pump subunit AcrA (membrane-fusion protein)